MSKVIVRKMKQKHLDYVEEIEKISFTSPWTKETFYQEIENNTYAHYFVVELANEIVGYAGMWVVEDDAQITYIAIKSNHRRHKIGEKILLHLFKNAVLMVVNRLFIVVRALNIAAYILSC